MAETGQVSLCASASGTRNQDPFTHPSSVRVFGGKDAEHSMICFRRWFKPFDDGRVSVLGPLYRMPTDIDRRSPNIACDHFSVAIAGPPRRLRDRPARRTLQAQYTAWII